MQRCTNGAVFYVEKITLCHKLLSSIEDSFGLPKLIYVEGTYLLQFCSQYYNDHKCQVRPIFKQIKTKQNVLLVLGYRTCLYSSNSNRGPFLGPDVLLLLRYC